MAKAEIVLPNGTHVSIDGSPEEVAKVISLYGGGLSNIVKSSVSRSGKAKKASLVSTSRKNVKIGPQYYISMLAEDGFFKKKKTIANVQSKLEEMGHIYAQSSISAPLIRLVRSHQLRRIKEKDGWVYVNK